MSATAPSPRSTWTVPDKPSLEGLEAAWDQRWEQDGTYRFDRTKTRDQVFSIDTPPPTVSGSLHVGHVFSYTHTDTVARYHRLRGDDTFFLTGTDEHGIKMVKTAADLNVEPQQLVDRVVKVFEEIKRWR